ncbi:hypothetical protein OPV22_021466 [Ensete ventricosum]|uniref:Aluminum resistance protein n=1 Tax=Ensete ventricosum TaxID=4639 RepID=A0AAV8QD45_ENSVE|nr:hypothetical protein OPV22_021466 [Ensete ventricosum]
MALSLSYSSSAAFTVVACPARSPPPRRLPSAVCFIRAVDTAPRAPLPCASSTYPPQPFVPEVAEAVESLYSEFRDVDNLVAHNSMRVLKAFQNAGVGSHHFNGCTGYGHDDGGGRETLDSVFAKIVGAESAIVRSQFFSGTHAIACALFAFLRPGNELLAVAGAPYDTLEEVIGIRQSSITGSLKDFGVTYHEVPKMGASTGMLFPLLLSIADIERAIRVIKMQKPDCMVMVDNCYGEFVETYEPPMVGADLIAGSLIKNPGGTIAPCGGYVAGKRIWVEAAAARLSAPGLGVDCGSMTGDVRRALFQGLFLSPQMVGEAIKGGLLIAEVMSMKGYKVQPLPRAPRHDIVQAVQLGGRERLISFCEAVQRSCPIGSYIKPTAGVTTGYASEMEVQVSCHAMDHLGSHLQFSVREGLTGLIGHLLWEKF